MDCPHAADLEVDVLVIHLCPEAGHSALQGSVALGLAAPGGAHKHDAKPDVHGVVQLDNLSHVRVRQLQPALVKDELDLLLQVSVVLRMEKWT